MQKPRSTNSQVQPSSSATSRAPTKTTPVGPFSSSSSSYSLSAPSSSRGRVQTRILFSFLTRSAFPSQKKRSLTTPQEMDELVDEWTPEPLAQPLTAQEEHDLAAIPIISGPNGPKPKLMSTGKTVINLASFNFTGLSGNEEIKARAVEILRKYGLGSCGPPGFYGTLGKSPLTCLHCALYAHAHRLSLVQTFICNWSRILPISSARKQLFCTLKGFRPSPPSFLHSVNAVTSLSLTVGSTLPFKKASRYRVRLYDGSITMI